MVIGYKTSETLLGIETKFDLRLLRSPHFCYKTSETLLGIETLFDFTYQELFFGYKTSETLLGIETTALRSLLTKISATKPLKPF